MTAPLRTRSPSPNTSWRLRVSKVDMLGMACLLSASLSGIHSAIHGKIRPGHVRRLRTGDERHHRSDFIDAPVAVECRGGLLRYRPLARGGIQIRIDRTRLYVVDRDAPAPDLSGQRLSKYLHGSLRGRVGHKPGHQDTLAHARADHDDATAALHVLQRRLRRDEYAADVDVDHAVHLFQRGLLELLRNGRAGIVHQYIQSAEGRDGLFDRGLNGVGVGSLRLNRDRPSAGAFNRFDNRRGGVRPFGVGNGNARSVRGQALGNRSTDATRPSSDHHDLARQLLSIVTAHMFCPFYGIKLWCEIASAFHFSYGHPLPPTEFYHLAVRVRRLP